MTIYLIRHTEVAVGRSICYGGSDVELADNYPDQLSRVQTNLLAPPDLVWSSPLKRCRTLAQDITPPGTAIQYDDRLREYHFGDWEMLPWADIPRAELDTWMADFVTIAPPGGESFQALANRVGTFWHEQIMPLAAQERPKNVYLVAHGGVIRTLLCLFLDLSLRNAYRLHLDYAAVSKVAIQQGTYQVVYINR